MSLSSPDISCPSAYIILYLNLWKAFTFATLTAMLWSMKTVAKFDLNLCRKSIEASFCGFQVFRVCGLAGKVKTFLASARRLTHKLSFTTAQKDKR